MSAILALTACSSAPKSSEVKQPSVSQYQGQIRIHDKIKNQRHVVNTQVRAISGQLRADFTAAGLGVYLGSMVSRLDGMALLLARERKFYESANPNSSLRSLIGVDIKPLWLAAVVHDENPGQEFSCTYTFDQKPVRCVSGKEALSIEWSEREGASRQVLVKSPQFEVQVSINTKSPKVQDPSTVFYLAAPKGYQQLTL